MSMPTDAPTGADNAALARAQREEDRLLPQIDHLTIVQLRRRAADNRDDAKRLGAIGATCGIAMLIADAERCDRRATELEFESTRASLKKHISDGAHHATKDATRSREFSVRFQTGLAGSSLRCQESRIEVHTGQDVAGAAQPDFTKSSSNDARAALSPRKPPACLKARELVKKTVPTLPRN